MLGSVAILHGATPSAVEVRQVAERTAAAAVLHLSSIDGVMREPSIRVLTGTPGEVVLRENGITYRLDPTRVMFAMGNRTERARMGTIVTAGERVGDLCAGIGYFTIPMARAGASVHAIEINPVAYSYLCRNAQENGVEGRVSAVLGDCRECMDGTYDRIVIGHFEAVRFLPEALEHARKGSVLHLHGLSSDRFDIARCTAESGFTAAEKVRLVKKYGPHTWHVVRDVVLQ
jgi:tRNA wybutosine-synthesizing protein 2